VLTLAVGEEMKSPALFIPFNWTPQPATSRSKGASAAGTWNLRKKDMGNKSKAKVY
jgi:hypothetical protein